MFSDVLKSGKCINYIVLKWFNCNCVDRYHLKGPKKGTTDIIVEGLPGLPDNIQEDGSGGFYIALAMPVDDDYPALPQKLGPYPLVRKFLARLLYLMEAPAEFIENIYPNYYSKRLKHWVSLVHMLSI